MTKQKKPTKLSLPTVPGDRVLRFAVITLLGLGLIMIFSAGVAHGNVRFGDEYYFFKRQLIGVALGLVLALVLSRVPYQVWRRVSAPMFFVSVILLVLVLIPGIGTEIYGAYRWLDIGPVSFQPSELMKLALILYLAAWLSGREEGRRRDFYEGLLPFSIILAIVGFLVLKQPDTGTFGVLCLIALAIYFVSGARFSHFAAMVGVGLGLLAILITVSPYRLERVRVFMDAAHDPSGAGYQMHQALIAIGSGGFLGQGLGQSRQKFNYLPEPVTDSIFAIIGEELGFVGTIAVIVLFIVIAWRGFRIAIRAPDEFGRYLSVGIVFWIVIQAFVNIFAISGIIPLTGIPLPLISYGGTSVAVILAAIGILLNVSKQGVFK